MEKPSGGRPFTWLDLAALAGVLILGLIHLPAPLQSDQALDLMTAREMLGGQVLYRDLWDARQPGIFAFYLLAGVLFGFDEIGLHLLELAGLMAFSLLLLVLLRDRFRSRAVASLVPLFTVGAYYATIAKASQLTQPEALAGPPLFLALWFALDRGGPSGGGRLRLFLSGFFGGIALQFKLLLAPIPGAFWLALLIRRTDSGDRPWWRIWTRMLAPVSLGVILSFLPFLAYVLRHGMAQEVYQIFFIYPPQASEVLALTFRKFYRSMGWFMVWFAPLLVLAAVPVARAFQARADRDPFRTDLVLWLVAGAAVTVVQIWWSFHWYIFFVPVGILAALGVDELWARRHAFTRGRRRLAAIALALLALPMALTTAYKVVLLAVHEGGLAAADRASLQAVVGETYGMVREDTRFLEAPASLPGRIYVFGDALNLYFPGRRSALAVNGTSPLMWTPPVWRRVEEGLHAVRPPYIFVQQDLQPLIRQRSPAIAALLGRGYRPISNGRTGTWYVRGGGPAEPGHPSAPPDRPPR